MVNQKEIRLSGSGGQGLILGGIILAEAALLDGKNAIQSQSYGPEARGGASKAEVIISDDTIDYPKVEKADLLLALTDKAYHKYIKALKEGGILIIDSNVEVDLTNKAYKIIKIPIIETAAEKIGKSMVANIVALGVIRVVTEVVTEASLERAVLKRVPKGTEELNKAALQQGYLLAEEFKNI
ncbi:2-oxoacid:ferredoxin oxidoreductase subunit gamma [Alkaliphilus pronyensis]|uniref:2-oxoacid:ferredoxin oxidoreductase subunit gamma n=1 Tax=Alkaliphilus pronyensis TaxID=1482732 RepID=A0A6I0FA25_9FIRM|nr:2-oxoacid:acceptor oxidoreductase family protein [Alkaliphilus pronyensis]KAB3534013.1 2-oxoacid:ferredoxin oxidoreductase subunit gamma [Alkaliphilus pronyensis]